MKLKNTELYLVGGCVRDKLLKRKSKDTDYIAITKLSFNKLCKEIEKQGRIFQAKKEFLTIRCSINDEVVDIALPRKEDGYDDNRHPKNVHRVKTLKMDAQRRDFTMNALYWNEKDGYIDYFDGKDDIKNKIIKTVGSPLCRFKEDYLRILRAIRFSCQLNFNIDRFTYTTMKCMANKIAKIEPNRVRDELNKSLLANPKKTVKYINELHLWDILKDMGISFQLTSKKLK